MKVRIFLILSFIAVVLSQSSRAQVEENAALSSQDQSGASLAKIDAKNKWSVRIADSFINRHPAENIYDSVYNGKWTYGQGVVLEGLHQLWLKTKNPRYLNYIKCNIDMFIGGDGSIRTYKYKDFNIDNINTGRQLLFLYSVTKDKKYKSAADTLRKQLANQPRTKSNGFWHKQIYPCQMWLEGLYMAEPFYAQYSKMFGEKKNFDDIAYQFIHIEEKTRDEKTGLLYHAWDESLQQKWADPKTGRSPNFWARAMGWYAMAIVDVLDYFPKNHPKRRDLIRILKSLSSALVKVRDEQNGLWYQVIDQGTRQGNYHEASATCMFAYAFAKGANKGYLGRSYLKLAKETFEGVIAKLATIDENGYIDLHHTCRGAGLGGNPYRNGSYEYYISEPQRTNDLKGLGPFILTALELEKAKMLK
ncbi:MAG: glycoside hydrolase family 88/105 protein [archaeon]